MGKSMMKRLIQCTLNTKQLSRISKDRPSTLSLWDPDAPAQMSNEVKTFLKTLKKKNYKVKTIKHIANKDDMPTTATYNNSSGKEVDLSEESVHLDPWLIK